MTVETMHTAIMKKVLLALISLVLISCRQGVVYDEFKSLPTSGWDADSALLFTPFVADTIGGYEVQIIVRHTARYPYQNLWLFVDVMQDSLLLRRDTIESFLANERGEWYGAGMQLYELPLLYLENIALSEGQYAIAIQQGMREDQLRGINDIGLKIIKK